MNGVAATALLVALALVVYPASPRPRLGPRRIPRAFRVPRGLVCAAACLAAAAAVLLPVTTVLTAAIVGATAAARYRRRRRLRLAAHEGLALEGALDVLVGELRAGSHPVRAFSSAADEIAGSVAGSFRAVAARARLGADVTGGLHEAGRTSGLPAQWDRLAVCWRLASEHGLAIATLMRAAQRDIVERQRFSSRVSAGLAGARATAAILAALPALGVLLGQLIGARPLSFLLAGHAGGWLMVVGSTLTCVGLMWSDRLTDRAAA